MSVFNRVALIAVALLAGCADAPEKIATSYVSPLEYQSFDCQQLSAELMRVTTKANELAGTLQQASSNDSTKMGVGLILFWPTLFFLSGNTPQTAEFAQLKGRRDAIEQEAIMKKCALPKVEPIAPPAPPVKQAEKSPLYH
jgi:hypothetical protein